MCTQARGEKENVRASDRKRNTREDEHANTVMPAWQTDTGRLTPEDVQEMQTCMLSHTRTRLPTIPHLSVSSYVFHEPTSHPGILASSIAGQSGFPHLRPHVRTGCRKYSSAGVPPRRTMADTRPPRSRARRRCQGRARHRRTQPLAELCQVEGQMDSRMGSMRVVGWLQEGRGGARRLAAPAPVLQAQRRHAADVREHGKSGVEQRRPTNSNLQHTQKAG